MASERRIVSERQRDVLPNAFTLRTRTTRERPSRASSVLQTRQLAVA
jgi:hypothetical protein